jgi:hypothetical protein
MDIQLKKDITFLLSFAPADDPQSVPEGLSPMFYFTGTHEGDVEIAKNIADIKSRYITDQTTDSDTE